MLSFEHLRRGWRLPLAAIPLLLITGVAWAENVAAPVGVLQLRTNFYMLTVDGLNIGVQTGEDGVLVVDPGPVNSAAAVLKTIRQLSTRPIRFLIDTSADPDLTGGNAALSIAGESMMIGFATVIQFGNDIDNIPASPANLPFRRAPIIAREGVLEQIASSPAMQASPYALPTEVFTRAQYNLRFNGDVINVFRMPPAHSSADSTVLFRRADIVVAGAIFDITHFPVIDLQHGGSIDGEIAAINEVMNSLAVPAVPAVTNDDGTLVIPLRGPVCNQPDVWSYRDMLYAVRARVEDLLDHGESLQQIQAADPAQGFRRRYGSDSGDWTTQDFVDAVYKSLMAKRRAGGRKGER